jgi:sigma-B regulation protein RsbU (phosphoserine phosphatase)
MSDELEPLSFRYQKALAPLARLSKDASVGKRLSELLTLLDFGTTLNRSLGLSEILDLVLFAVMGETRADWAAIALRQEDGSMRFVARRGASAPEREESFGTDGAQVFSAAVLATDDRLEGRFREQLAAWNAALVAPLRKGDRWIGLLILGSRPDGFGPAEQAFVEALSISAAASIDNGRIYEELQSVNQRLTLKVYQLRSLFDITRELLSALSPQRVRAVLVASAMGQPLATRCAFLRPGGAVESRGVTFDARELDLLRTRVDVLQNADGVTTVRKLPAGPLRDLLSRTGFEVALPLRSGGSGQGVLLVGRKANGEPLSEEDLDFLQSLAAQGAAALDNLRLTREWVEKQKLEKEMAVAREIQRGLLPESDPVVSGWDIAGINIPCLTVGGDYYDYMECSGGRLGVTIADVSGKGTGPALLMASVQASLRALSAWRDLPLDELFTRLNAMVFRSTESNKYVTIFYGLLDPATGELQYVNAGHVYPLLLRRTGEAVPLSDGSPVIGLLPEIDVSVGRATVDAGELLVLYTDGLSEARNPAGEEFEERGIVAALREAESLPAREIVGRLVSGIRLFAAEAGLIDDLTLVVLRRL